jgi:hypothetical protein
MTDVVVAALDASPEVPPSKKKTSRGWLLAKIVLAVAVILACFVYSIPKFASYSDSRPRSRPRRGLRSASFWWPPR